MTEIIIAGGCGFSVGVMLGFILACAIVQGQMKDRRDERLREQSLAAEPGSGFPPGDIDRPVQTVSPFAAPSHVASPCAASRVARR